MLSQRFVLSPLVLSSWFVLLGCACGDGSKQATPAYTQPTDPNKSGKGTTFFLHDIGAPVEVPLQLQFPEGPVWSDSDNVLYLTDISDDAIYRFSPPDLLETVHQPAAYPDGLALDPDGRFVVAGFGSRSVWRLDDGEVQTLADTYDGKKLNSPDDVVVRSDGTIYFTDPTYGIDGTVSSVTAQTAELDFQGVYRIDPEGVLHLEDGEGEQPNGIGLSPDENTLYVTYTGASEIDAFSVQADGALTDKTRLVDSALGADSMTVDSQGNLYVSVYGGILIVRPDGSSIGTLTLPNVASNVSFGGSDRRTLFITAHALLVDETKSPGLLYRIDDMPVAGLPGRP